MSTLADEDVLHGCLHGSVEMDSIGFGVLAMDFDALDQWEPFLLPGVIFNAVRIGGSLVIAENVEGGALAGHDNPGGPHSTLNAGESSFGGIDRDGFRDEKSSFGKIECPIAVVDGMLDRVGIVSDSIPLGPKKFWIGHGKTSLSN